ncbi:MAG TPA: hypothetical protein ENK83_05965, partial [Aliiroseovarius sp.]|nr:hypothetical protein [Aliiroseovarius sp.]
MPIQLTSTKFQTEEITPSLFGSNIVFPYSAFLHPGDRVTTALEDDIGVGTLRYPGGAVTETYFDIKNPNATSAPGHTNVLAQNEFFDILRDGANQSAVMVLPVTALIEHRATLSDFYHYVRLTLNEAWNGGNDPVAIETFELGNEWYYEGLTAEAYAAAAADIAKQARAAIENFANSLPANAKWDAPTIAVQLSDKQGDGNENETANAAIIDVFEAHDALTAIDAVTAHMYYPFGTEYFFGADIFYGEPVYSMWDAADAWDAALR